MKTSVWMSAVLAAVLAAAGCKDEEKPTPKQAKTPETKAPGTKAPEIKQPETPPEVTPPEVTPPPTTESIEGIGPFESIDAYCEQTKSKFVAKDCETMMNGGMDVCSCNTRSQEVGGKRQIGPLPEATGLASAQLLVVERSAADSGDCDLAIETANGRGWFVVPKLMPCTSAPAAHDSGTSVEVQGFDVSRENEVDVLTLAWTETTSDMDVDGTQTDRDAKFTTRCTIGAASLPLCEKPTKQPETPTDPPK